MDGRGLSVLFMGILLIFGTILLVREIDRPKCNLVLIKTVGGCNSAGVCGVLFSGINGISKGNVKFPVAGQSICREELSK